MAAVNRYYLSDVYNYYKLQQALILKTGARLWYGRHTRLFIYAKKHGYAILQKAARSFQVEATQQVHSRASWRHPSLACYEPISQGDLFGRPNFIPQLKRLKNENL